MGYSSFIGTACSEPSGEKSLENWMKEMIRQIEESRRKNGEPRWWITGIDYGFTKGPKRIPVVIGW